MARTIRAEVEGVAALAAALKLLGDGLDHEIAAELQAAAEPIAVGARHLMPRGPGPRATAKNPSDHLPHIADTIYAVASGQMAQIVSPHPAAVVFEYGGDIKPREIQQLRSRTHTGPVQKIAIPRVGMAHKAAEAALPAIEADLERRLDALAARLGVAG